MPVDSEMIEEMARAIAHARSWQTTALTVGDWDDRSKPEREPFLEMAQACASIVERRVGWQPIETFAEPTSLSSGNGVLVTDADGNVGEAYFRNFDDDDNGWWWANTTWGDYPEPERPNNPTHWMPLPDPPAALKESSNG